MIIYNITHLKTIYRTYFSFQNYLYYLEYRLVDACSLDTGNLSQQRYFNNEYC